MPEMANIISKYSDRVGFIALLDDYSDSMETAVKIVENSGANMLTVDARHSDFMELVRMAYSGYVPPTILIGKDGGMIGEHIIGAYGDRFAELIEDALGR